MQGLDKILVQKADPKVPEMVKLWQFSQGHAKSAFSKKEQRGGQGKFLKNRPKSSPRFKGPKAHWRKWHYPLNSTNLKCKNWRTFWRKQRLQKCPKDQVIAIFARWFKTRIYLKKAKGGQGKFFKNRPKSRPRLKGPKALLRKWHYPLITMHLKGKDWRRF